MIAPFTKTACLKKGAVLKRLALAALVATSLGGCVLEPVGGPPPPAGYYGYGPSPWVSGVNVDLDGGWGHGGGYRGGGYRGGGWRR
jgi:hypothetical protein